MPNVILDQELSEQLKKARKTPRNFVLIYKGVTPLKLLVRKKKIRESDATKLKTEEKGNGYVIGVIHGDGSELVFFVTGEEPGVKPARLRALISEMTGLTLKVQFKVVPNLPEVPEEDDEEESTESAEARTAPGTSEGVTPPRDTRQLLAAINKLSPQIQAAVAANPTRKAEFGNLVTEFHQHVQSADLVQAKAVLEQLVDLLKSNAPAGKVSLVKLGKARLEWIGVRDAAVADIRKLQAALEKEFGDDAEQKQVLQSALTKLDDTIRKLEVKLSEELDQVLNANEADRPPLVAVARKTIGDLTRYLDSDPIIAELDDNEVVPGMAVVAPIRSKLNEISAALG